jgi:hypothetical protein
MSAIEKGDLVRATHRDSKTVLEGRAFLGTTLYDDPSMRVELHFSSPLLSHLESNHFIIEKVEATA